MEERLKEALVRYCVCILEQSKLRAPNAETKHRRLPDIALLEALRILDALCSLDSTLVPKLFPNVKKLFQLNRTGWTNRANGYIFLEALQFFLHHGEVVLYDPEPLFRMYFDTYLNENCTFRYSD